MTQYNKYLKSWTSERGITSFLGTDKPEFQRDWKEEKKSTMRFNEEMSREVSGMGGEDINRAGEPFKNPKTAVVALITNDNYDNFVILTDGSVLKLDKRPIKKNLLTKENSISDAWNWLKMNVQTKNDKFFKTNYTYNQLTGSKSDYELLDKYDFKISQPSTATKLLFYDEFSKRTGNAERLAEQPYKTR